MDTTTTQVGPELPPRLRAQYSNISSDPEMEPPRAKSVEKVKKHKDKSKYKSKWEQDFQNLSLTEGKLPKAPQATGKYYKMVDPCFEERMHELNRKFGNICISPRPQAAPGVRAPLHMATELGHQARQNICTLNFSAVFNHTISECSSVMDRCRDSIKSTIKKAKHQILKGADPERAIKNAYGTTRLHGYLGQENPDPTKGTSMPKQTHDPYVTPKLT